MVRNQDVRYPYHTTVFQAEIYSIERYLQENNTRGGRGQKIVICIDSQATTKALASKQNN